MKTALVFALIVSLLTPSMSFAQAEARQSWSKMHNWQPGSEVTMRTTDSHIRLRYFISADDTGTTLLNVADIALPPDVVRSMRRTIAEHPDYFPVRDGMTVKFDERTSLATDGLFVAGRKVADYDQVIERIARNDAETGAVVLDVKKGWSASKQLLVTLGVICLAGILTMPIVCAVGRCD